VAARLAGLGVRNVVVLAGVLDSARLVHDLRTVAPEARIYGGPAMGRRRFLREAGGAAEGVTLAVPSRPDSDFAARFKRRHGHPPDYAAQHAYDAMRMVLAAVGKAGLDRAAVREALLGLSPYEGVSGVIGWDELRRNSRAAGVAIVSGGAVRRP
jgi:branched-chain amino acid transport system substrate-binding protein